MTMGQTGHGEAREDDGDEDVEQDETDVIAEKVGNKVLATMQKQQEEEQD